MTAICLYQYNTIAFHFSFKKNLIEDAFIHLPSLLELYQVAFRRT